MVTVTKKTLARRLHSDHGLPAEEAKTLVNLFFKTLTETIASGYSVKLAGLGNFMLREKKARLGRNPKTKEPFPISARTVVSFKPGGKLAEHVNAKRLDKRKKASKKMV